MAGTTLTVVEDGTTITVTDVSPNATRLRNVSISATAPSAGQALISTSATACAWADIATQAELDAWIGSTNVTTLGTITTGVWSGTTIATTKGGTGLTSYMLGDTLYASATNVLSALAGNTTTTRKFLRQLGTGTASAAPAWDTLTAADIAAGTFQAGTYSFSGSTISAATSITSSAFVGPLTGNADTATKLATARAINGVDFDGSAAITVTAAAGTLTGDTLNATVVTSSLTAVGTIATGVWSGTAIGATKGGTAQTTYALGDTLYASATDTLSKLTGNTTTTRKFLRQTGDGANSAAPAWDTVTKTDVGLSAVENTALSTWAGSTAIVTLGTISTGTVPAANVSAGSFGAGDYTFTGKLTFAGTPTLADGTIGLTAVNGLTLRAITGSTYDYAVLCITSGAAVLGIKGTATTIAGDVTITTGRLYVQGTSAASIIDRALQVGNAANTGTRLQVGASQTDTATGAAARKVYVAGVLAAAANNDVLYGMEIAPTVSVGAFTGTTFYGLKIGDISGAATNFALYTGAGAVRFGGQVTSAVTTGTAPFVVASTTVVANLNVSQLLGATWAAPAAIGSGTPAAGSFTTVSGSTSVQAGAVAVHANISSIVGTPLFFSGGNSGAAVQFGMAQTGNNNNPFVMAIFKTKATTTAASGAVSAGTNFYSFDAYAADGTAYVLAGRMSMDTDAGTIGTGRVPTRWRFFTHPDSTGTITEVMYLDSALTAGFSGAVILAETKALRFDGSATGDTYITSPSANVLDLYAGGVKALSLAYVSAGVASAAIAGPLTTNGGLQTFGANDSGGAGYRLVLVPNSA